MELLTSGPGPRIEDAKTDTYRLIVFNPAGTSVLLQARETTYSFPTIQIPQFTRTAREITVALRAAWHIRCIFLFSMAGENGSDAISVLESQSAAVRHPADTEWFDVRDVLAHGKLRSDEQQALRASHAKVSRPQKPEDAEPFGRLGWMDELKNWVKASMQPQSCRITNIEQFNASETFALVRLDRAEGPLWFKAVGEPNLHEYGITLTLAHLFPRYLPKILATKADCHGWLMPDAGGIPLTVVTDPRIWESAITTLAKLQLDSIHRVAELRAAGCRNLEIGELASSVDGFFGKMSELMQRQTKVPPQILTREDLAALKTTLHRALDGMVSPQIPLTLGHSDFNPGNIITDERRCVFIDWAEAHVGHPFLTFEYFLAHLRKDYPQLAPLENQFRNAHSKVWKTIASDESIAEAYRFSPLVAVYAYAIAGNAWQDPERLKEPRCEAYLRTLTRRMKEQADLLEARSNQCLN